MHKFFILIHLLHTSTCFEHYCAHLQEDSFISTASGIVTLETSGWFILFYMFRALLCSSSGGQIVLVQHLVSSLWKQVCGLYSSICFEHYCAHLQEDNCISTASGIVTLETSVWFILLYMFRALLCSSSGGQLY